MAVDDKALSREAAEAINKWKESRSDLAERKKKYQKGTYIKFPDELKVAIQLLAAQKEMGYQTYLKMVLAEHIEKAKKDGTITSQLIEKAMREMLK